MSKRKPRPPVVLSKAEIARVLSNMAGTHQLMAKLLYGCGLRLMADRARAGDVREKLDPGLRRDDDRGVGGILVIPYLQ